MRKYRGKRVDNGEWTYGYYFKIWEQTYILWGTTNDIPNMEEVDPKTVGQSIGLNDKIGQELWEGDISQRYYNEHYPELIGVIKWDETQAQFVWYAKFPNGEAVSCNLGHYLNGHSSSHKKGESKQDLVIGNITDNPKLLTKVKDMGGIAGK
ncbi:hypothetical protein LCGC14_2351600 [marine sediment metagenome]|uniref:YopX protein domain-containing protein n=1 Tax=marine sediment metagenome TaxID=412755 RepID=A0A0F9C904_9ZZZZ